MPRTMPSANDVEVEGRLGQLEWHARATEARFGAAEQRIEATGQLAGQLDGFAASVAEYSARLDQQGLAHQKAIETLANKFEEKLEIIGAAFDDCNPRQAGRAGARSSDEQQQTQGAGGALRCPGPLRSRRTRQHGVPARAGLERGAG